MPKQLPVDRAALSDRDVLWLVYGTLNQIGGQLARQNTLLRIAILALALIAGANRILEAAGF